jgi:hypothetical protein
MNATYVLWRNSSPREKCSPRKKVRKAITKNGDKATENHASQKQANVQESRESWEAKRWKGKKTNVNFFS